MANDGGNGKRLGGERNIGRCLLCRVHTRLCALPIEHTVETMRPLPVEPIADMPAFLLGIAIIRGEPVPVVDAAHLLGADGGAPSRFVTVRAGDRCVALAVDAVLGVSAIAPESLQELPLLLRDANAEAIAAIGTLDAALLLMLETARLVPERLWPMIDATQQRPAARGILAERQAHEVASPPRG